MAAGNQTITKWVNENVYQRFYKYLDMRQYLLGYENAPIGFDFTNPNVSPALRSEIEETISYLREANPDVDIRLEFAG